MKNTEIVERLKKLSVSSDSILEDGNYAFERIISELDVTDHLLTEDSRNLLFLNYKRNIHLYKYTNELLRLNMMVYKF